jgi:hypothetical protein
MASLLPAVSMELVPWAELDLVLFRGRRTVSGVLEFHQDLYFMMAFGVKYGHVF